MPRCTLKHNPSVRQPVCGNNALFLGPRAVRANISSILSQPPYLQEDVFCSKKKVRTRGMRGNIFFLLAVLIIGSTLAYE